MKQCRPLMFLLLFAAASCGKHGSSPSIQEQNKLSQREVKLYFESPDMLLVPEVRKLDLPQNAAGAMSLTLREYFKGPSNPSVPRLFPADTAVRGSYFLPDGTVFVDLGGATLTQGWNTGSHQELMAIQSLHRTVTVNFPEVRSLRILLNGEPAETLAGHISTLKPILPLREMVDPRHP